MTGSMKIFRNMNRLNLSTGSIFVSILAFLGAVLAFLIYLWMLQATSKTVDLTPNPPKVGAMMKPTSTPTIPRLDVDVVLIADWSGSMKRIGNKPGSDPDGLRLQAAEVMGSSLAADIFPRHTRMGYIQFAGTAVIAQELIDVDDKNTRIGLIDKIYKLSPDVPSDQQKLDDWLDHTNIVDAFNKADAMFDQAKALHDPTFVSNTPSIVFLTDGRPTAGGESEAVVKNTVQKLIDKGTIVFVVILRNPNNPDPDNVNGIGGDPLLNFANWRAFWYRMASEQPEHVKYFEAQDNTQLEGIYNTIRARLVKEGTKPADRIEYDPRDPNTSIHIPPGLLQAHLLVNHPNGVKSIELIDFDGLNFQEDIKRDPEKNEILEGNLFYRFSIDHPHTGEWKLKTDAQQTLYYLLIMESIYTARAYRTGGDPYLDPGKSTELPFFVVDDQQNQVSDKIFDMKAYSVQTFKQPDGSYTEQAVAIADLSPVTQNGETKYILNVTPELLAGKDALQIQIDGTSSDGALINLSSYTIPVLSAPSGVQINAPASMICDSKGLFSELFLWPPAIHCNNSAKITATVQDSALLSDGTLYGKIYSPLASSAVDMSVIDKSTLQADLKPLQSVGKYEIAVDVGGKIGGKSTDYEWQNRESATIRVDWPLWIEPGKHQALFAAVLLLIIALWKPIIVAMLLPLFAIIRVAPNGFYTDNNDENGAPDQIYGLAMKRRKLFALSISTSKNCDVTTLAAEDPIEDSFTSSRKDRLMLKLYRWLKAQPRARIVAVPWGGIWVEKPSGEFEKANERTYTSVTVDGVNVRIGQRDWKEEDLNP